MTDSPHHKADDGRGPREVFLNGELIEDVVEAHTAEGWIIKLHRRSDGILAVNGPRYMTERLVGEVVVKTSTGGNDGHSQD